MQWTKQELVRLWANNDKRREFLKNYKEWGVWLTVPELGLTYHQYALSDGTRILAMEYQRQNPYPLSGEDTLQTIAVYYLWDGVHFTPNSASEWEINDRLKKLKAAMQSELRTAADTTEAATE